MCKIDNELNDNQLVINVKKDIKDAYKLLYNTYNKGLYYFSLKYLDNSEEAKELVQSVFINIWIHRKSLDETIPIKNYIYKSARNYICNYLKKKTIRSRFVETELYKGEIQSNHTYDQVLFNDLENSINLIVETMPLRQQEVFHLSRFKGLSHKKIAEKLNLSLRTVENHVYRALKIIKSKLKEYIFSLSLI